MELDTGPAPYEHAKIVRVKLKALRENTVWDSPSSVRVYVENLGKVLEMMMGQYYDDHKPAPSGSGSGTVDSLTR